MLSNLKIYLIQNAWNVGSDINIIFTNQYKYSVNEIEILNASDGRGRIIYLIKGSYLIFIKFISFLTDWEVLLYHCCGHFFHLEYFDAD